MKKRIIAVLTGLLFLAQSTFVAAAGFPFQPNTVLNAADLNAALQTAAITSGNIGNVTITNSLINTTIGSFTSLTSPSVGFTGGLIDGIAIGTATPAAGTFTNLTSNGTVAGTGFSLYFASPPAIGGTVPNTGRFTSLTATGTATANVVSAVSATIAGGTIDGAVVGSSVAAAGTFTSLTATGSVNGPGTGLTGTAAGLSIGGNAATASGINGTVSSKLPSLTATVAANAMTVGASSQYLDFRSATSASGTPSTILAAPTALVIPASATLGTVSGNLEHIMVLELNNGGTAELAVVNLSGGVDLDEEDVISTTAISSAATASGVVYSTNARTNVSYRVVGALELTEATAGAWATAPSNIAGTGAGQPYAAMHSLGYGQTWQSVTRTSGTTYYNTTNRPIMLAINAVSTVGPGSMSMQFTINGVTQPQMVLFSNAAGAYYMKDSIIIPPGASYSVTATGANINAAFELR